MIALEQAARRVLVTHSLPHYEQRDRDLAFEQLANALPKKANKKEHRTMGKYGKLIAAAIAAGGIALQVAVTDGQVTPAEGITIALAVLGALGVYVVPNAPAQTVQHRYNHQA